MDSDILGPRGEERTSRPPRICVVGSANMDLLCRVPRLPRMGETLVGHSFQMGCGGKGSNQAAMAAKLGAQVTMVVKLGRDPLGEITFENYQNLGIVTRYVFWDDQHFSGVAPIFVDDEGHNMIVIVPGANMALRPGDVRMASDAIRAAELVVCQLEIPVESTLEAFRIAKAAGIGAILNPAPATPVPDELLELSDIVAPNETETELLTGMPVGTLEETEAAARVLLRRGPRAVIITLGERGALLVDRENATHVPAVKVDVVDTTGAGDAFIGSLAYLLGEGRPLHNAVEKANAIAAMSVMKVGTQVSFPKRDEVRHLLDSQ